MTSGTRIEKLTREPSTKLTRINDLAGTRIVLDGGRAQQEQAVQVIVDHFSGKHPRMPQVIDRRLNPRSGYRAVHIIVYPDNYPVEIQVRTILQNLWAQIYESVADQWGRDIRYGGSPQDASRKVRIPRQDREFQSPDFAPLARGMVITRHEFVGLIQLLATLIDATENLEVDISRFETSCVRLLNQAEELHAQVMEGVG